jgi:hypothetical protein
MKNILPDYMKKVGKTPLEYDNDVVAISYITALVADRLQKITKTYHSPQIYAKKCLALSEHTQNLCITFILFNVNNMESNRLYKPSEFKDEINNSLQTISPDNFSDTFDKMVRPVLHDNKKNVTSKDISKALKVLESEMAFEKAKSKDEVKKIKGNQKIEFIGRPHFYKLPNIANEIKRVLSNPEAVAITFRSLRKLGLERHLNFLLKASFYAVRESNSRNLYFYSKTIIDRLPNFGITFDQPGWESYRELLITASDDQIEKAADKLADLAANCPERCSFILLLAILGPV